ncbi:MAG TPA: TraR/DksA C4-type zinc finger protein [Vicinamibacteria bacterium]
MKKTELLTHKKALLEKKQNLERSIGMKGMLTGGTSTDGHGDFADRSAAANEEEISIQLKQTDAKLLRAIEDALARVEAGTYGICVDCEEEISPARLKAVPWTKVCISCKEKQYS